MYVRLASMRKSNIFVVGYFSMDMCVVVSVFFLAVV